jgi:hypothetical protein
MSQRRQVAFYVKGRPQGADIREIVLKYHRVFIGYPPFRRGADWDRHNVGACLLDIGVPDDAWRPGEIEPSWYGKFKAQLSRNRNMALLVAPGSIVVVPRTTEGLCYLGKVVAPFELENNPPWADEYLALRQEQRLAYADEASHIADVVQCWRVERWQAVPFPLVPRWIQYQVMGRTTLGEIYDRPDGRKRALEELTHLYEGRRSVVNAPTRELGEIVGRLLDWVSPSDFEHLICDLLQREQPGTRWWHTGGSGDGGADGIGIDVQGKVVGVLQCKWLLNQDPAELAADLSDRMQRVWGHGAKVYIATLFPRVSLQTALPNVEVLGPDDVAQLLWKHRAVCSLAQSLGIEP